jgi:hypothetical protein
VDGALENLHSLFFLDLSFNKLAFLHQDMFGQNRLEGLATLNLQNNQDLFEIDFNVMSSNFDVINLSTCNLSSIQVEYLFSDPAISIYNLNKNKLESMNLTDFQYTSSIIELLLSQNAKVSIEDGSFMKL